MSIKNPFRVLGIHPDLVKNLTFESLAGIIKSQYRALQVIYHPDKQGGSDKKSIEINEAYELLSKSSEKLYEHFKEQFLKSGKSANEEEIARLESLNEAYSNKVVRYFNELINENIFNPGACKLRIFDYSKCLNVGAIVKTKRSAKEDLSYDLIIDKNNELFKGEERPETRLENKILIGTISDDVATQNQGIKSILRMAGEVYTVEDADLRNNLARQRKFTGTFGSEGKIYENRIKPSGFKNILPFLRPQLRQHAYLFSVNQDDNGVFYSLDGRIREIDYKVEFKNNPQGEK